MFQNFDSDSKGFPKLLSKGSCVFARIMRIRVQGESKNIGRQKVAL